MTSTLNPHLTYQPACNPDTECDSSCEGQYVVCTWSCIFTAWRPDPSVGDKLVLAGEVEMERVPRPGSRVRGAVPDIITTQFIAATQASRHVSHVNISTTCLCIKIGTLVYSYTKLLSDCQLVKVLETSIPISGEDTMNIPV